MRSDYKICPTCGASLDVGETCSECQGEKVKNVGACIYPSRSSCKGCVHSFYPELFDGGCKLRYGNKKAV